MPMFVMCQGLPASGKSTYAEDLVRNAPAGNAVRVNRDLLRQMLNADRFAGKPTEKVVTIARDTLLETYMQMGTKVVISDDTNFHPSCEQKFRELAAKYEYDFIIKDFTDVSVKECIKRDLARPRSVGEKVIRDMHRRYLAEPWKPVEHVPGLPSAIVVDIDGTLAHMVAPEGGKVRSPYDYHRVNEDEPDPVVVDLVRQAYESEYAIIVMSGRDEECREVTEEWLNEHISFDHLYMRSRGDNRDDTIVKSELFDQHVLGKYNVRYVLDDRQKVVDMWRDRGLKCLQVQPGEF